MFDKIKQRKAEKKAQEVLAKKQYINEKISFLESYSRTPELLYAITGTSSLTQQIVDFYGLATWTRAVPRVGIVREWKVVNHDTSKGNITPSKSLVEIAQAFSETSINEQLLGYRQVWDDHDAIEKASNKRSKLILLSIAEGIPATLGIYLGQKIDSDILTYASVTAGALWPFLFMYFAVFYDPWKKVDSGAVAAYINLNEALKSADKFVNNYYRRNYLERKLL